MGHLGAPKPGFNSSERRAAALLRDDRTRPTRSEDRSSFLKGSEAAAQRMPQGVSITFEDGFAVYHFKGRPPVRVPLQKPGS